MFPRRMLSAPAPPLSVAPRPASSERHPAPSGGSTSSTPRCPAPSSALCREPRPPRGPPHPGSGDRTGQTWGLAETRRPLPSKILTCHAREGASPAPRPPPRSGRGLPSLPFLHGRTVPGPGKESRSKDWRGNPRHDSSTRGWGGGTAGAFSPALPQNLPNMSAVVHRTARGLS